MDVIFAPPADTPALAVDLAESSGIVPKSRNF
jgi:hypothetical protein